MLESLTTLAVVAGHTERIGVEVSVLQLALRQSAVVAEQLATLAYLAPGRLAVGIGVGGEHPAEWAACGVPRLNRGAATTASARDSPPSWPASQLASPTESRTASTRYRRSQCRFSSAAAGRPPCAARPRSARGGCGWLHSPRGFGAVRSTLRGMRQEARAARPSGMACRLPVFVSGSRYAQASRRALAEAHRPASSDRIPPGGNGGIRPVGTARILGRRMSSDSSCR